MRPAFARALPFFFALMLVAVSVGLRWGGRGQIIWSVDEGAGYTMASQVLAGDVPYRDAADNRNPLLPYFNALVYLVAGDWNVAAVQVAFSVMIGLTGVLVWRIARRAGDEPAGIAGALWFAGLSFCYISLGDAMATHTGWLLAFLSSLGFWFFAGAWTSGSGKGAFAAGACFALAFMAKQPGILDLGTTLVILALAAAFEPARRRAALQMLVAAAAGFAVVVGLIALAFIRADAADDFLLYAWTYNTRLYVPEVPLPERLAVVTLAFDTARAHVPVALVAGVAAALGLLRAVFVAWRGRGPARVPLLPWLILGWTAAGIVSTALSGRTFEHYLLQIVPALALACGWVSARMFLAARSLWSRSRRAPAIVLGLLLLGLAAGLVGSTVRQAREFKIDNGYGPEVATLIRQMSTPDERIFVWGYVPEMYVWAQRLPNTRFLYTNYLTGLIPWTNLDPLRDTSYAVVPGSWDDFWRDWEESPAAVVVDTLGQRGYFKYPLQREEKLWRLLGEEYAEFGGDYVRERGFRLFRRLAPPPAEKFDPAWPVNPGLAPSGQAALAGLNPRLAVRPPAGTRRLDLYLDGRPYRRFECPAGVVGEVVFTILARDLPDRHELRVVAHGERTETSPPKAIAMADQVPNAPGGPPLRFGDQEIFALETERIDNTPVRQIVPPYWDAHAPSRMVYPRPPELALLTIRYGIREGAYNGAIPLRTDGVTVAAMFWDAKGNKTQLFRRELQPTAEPRDRGVQTSTISLPLAKPGQIELLLLPGPRSDASADWSYWHSLEGATAPLRIRFEGRELEPVRAIGDLGATMMNYAGKPVMVAHAPAEFDFEFPAAMRELAGGFGVLDGAWTGPHKLLGAVFEVIHVRDDGSESMLLQRSLDPARVEADRGIIPFRVKIPESGGRLRLIARTPDARINAYAYTFWHNLTGNVFEAEMRHPGGVIHSTAAQGEHGVSLAGESDRPVYLAHAPATITFPRPAGVRRIEGDLGILPGAYAEGRTTAGATFLVEYEHPDGTRVELFRRVLDPLHVQADRGRHPFAAELPAGEGGRILYRTTAGPSGSVAFAWSFWGELRALP